MNRRIVRGAVWLVLALLPALPGHTAPADELGTQRKIMVEQLRQRGITKPEVLAAMEFVPRHRFAPESVRELAYEDKVLELGNGQTIYQPYVVALMTSLLDLKRGDKVLEVGTGSGYHAAVLSRIASEVYSMEIVASVASQAQKRLHVMGYQNIAVRAGDGYQGWPDKAPFDAILLSTAPPRIPEQLLKQLKVGGRMVLPVGGFFQDLLVITKTADGIEKRTIIPVRLLPMKGQIRNES
ncbi:MAG TPA: protein-L-isoaspartate(D-aspartate) O-methyltransferase [Thermoanaerobaculia bacterium]|nr:protein-L-isoaspartate(D-aspartate) O-methyltransferase [Thermoanaerobaculia bacterium]